MMSNLQPFACADQFEHLRLSLEIFPVVMTRYLRIRDNLAKRRDDIRTSAPQCGQVTAALLLATRGVARDTKRFGSRTNQTNLAKMHITA